MWVARFKMWHKSHMLEVTKKYDVKVHAYYLNLFEEGGRKYVNKALYAEGAYAEEAVREIANDPRAKVLFMKGSRLIYSLPVLQSFHATVLSKDVYSLRPQDAYSGYEYWTLGSNDKRALLRIMEKINDSRGQAGIELISMTKENPLIFSPGVLDSLTDLQREALLAAYHNGYYKYPRGIDVLDLAKLKKIPRTTLTEHLRKAEAKVMSLVLGDA